MTKWTDNQQQAIDARGCSLLVSAAAGSGKTAVLVERILQKVIKEQVDIDKILVVTFTKAAARQMKQRLSDALEKQLSETPDNEHLQKQTALIHHAAISTIDSFCLDVLRSHIHLTDMDPDFRVADPGEVILLERDTAEALLEKKYEEKAADFLALADNFEPQYREGALVEALLSFYHYSEAYPWPGEWRREAVSIYDIETVEELEKAPLLQYLVEDVRSQASDAVRQLRACLEAEYAEDPEKGYHGILRQDVIMLEKLSLAETYSELTESAKGLSWGRIRKVKTEDPECYARAKRIRDDIKDTFSKIKTQYLSASPEMLLNMIKEAREVAHSLKQLTDEFEKALTQAKKDRGIADFSDIEHRALDILTVHTKEADLPSKIAQEYAAAYDEIMIDEYQDSNLVQEILLRSVSGEWNDRVHNRFMVGDVKQSIYRFRQAMPEIFMEKYAAYQSAEGHAERKIELHHNFRSRKEILDGVNVLFGQLMHSDVGGITYNEDHALHLGAAFPEGDDPSFRENEIMLLTDAGHEEEALLDDDVPDMQKQETEELSVGELGKDEREAVVLGRRILAMVGKQHVLSEDGKTYRTVRYSDIAVLLRAVKGHAEVYVSVLRQMGIPAYTGGSTGYFDTPEVRTVLAYLRVLDNPRQDIPLAAVLRSPMGNFTDEELVRIRLQGERRNLWDDLQMSAEGESSSLNRKAKAFITQTERLRKEALLLPIHETIWRLYALTGYMDYVTAMPAGDQRKANLNMLVEKAAVFEKGSYRGLFHFLRYIDQMKTYEVDYGEAPQAGEHADTVLITSIHKSKGLEFPIVFVCGLGRNFNRREASGKLIMHPELGIAFKQVNRERHVVIDTPIFSVLARRCLLDAQGENLRVLYVALTRAKEKLILLGDARLPNDEDEGKNDLTRWLDQADTDEAFLPYAVRSMALRPLDLIMPAALRHSQAQAFLADYGMESRCVLWSSDRAAGFSIAAVSEGQEHPWLSSPGAAKKETVSSSVLTARVDLVYDAAREEELDRMAKKTYPYEYLANIPGKVSVSYLKAERYEQEQEQLYQLLRDRQEDEKETGRHASMNAAERGTLYHTFLEGIEMICPVEETYFEGQLERLVKCGKIQGCDMQTLKKDDFQPFFSSRLYQRMVSADKLGKLHREAPFVLGEKASKLKKEWQADDIVLIQGIIDVWFSEGDEIVVVDYKTDAVPGGDAASLVRKYERQLELYAQALERLTGRKVKQRLIWSFALGREIEV